MTPFFSWAIIHNMSITYARTAVKSAPMHDPHVARKAAEWVEHFLPRNGDGETGVDALALIEEKCGRSTRGKHKGELRGYLEVLYVERGGWRKTGGYMQGYPVRPGAVLGMKITGWSGQIYLAYGEVF